MDSGEVQTVQIYCDRQDNRLATQSFRLFDLPPELRDEIYRHLPLGPPVFCRLETNCETSDRGQHALGDSHAWLEQPSRSKILLSSKQLSREYVELQLRIPTTLILRGIHAPSKSNLSTQVVDAVRLYLSAECKEETHPANWDCVAVRIIREHTHCLKALSPNLPKHGAIHLRLGLWWYSDEQCSWPNHIHSDGLIDALDQLVRAVHIKDLEIVLFAMEDDYEAWSLGTFPSVKNWATWSEKSGWQGGPARGRPESDKDGRKKTLEEITAEEWWKVVEQTMEMTDG